MIIGAVVLNYNCSELSINVATSMASYNLFDKIILVDNNSNDQEKKKLRSSTLAEKISIIYNEKNAGYAAGNNIGLRELIKSYSCDICFIVNPDIIVSEETCKNISEFLYNNQEYGVVSAIRTDINHKYTQRQYWGLPNYYDCIKECFLLYRKKQGEKQIYEISTKNQYIEVDVIPGSFLGISSQALSDIEYLDEGTFLYNEENCLAQKMKNYKYKEALLTKVQYIHNHIKPNAKTNSFSVFKRGYGSKKHYIQTYILPNVSFVKKIVLMLLYKWCYFERWFVCLLTRK